jgi:dephospho-CoA kinase
MLRVGLTGGIGSGKSEVSRRLAALGAAVLDADKAAREVVAPGTPGLAQVVDAFGPGVLASDGSLDRPGLGKIVFGDEAARAKLNGIIHPLVRAYMRAAEERAIADGGASAVIVHDIPLLAEGGQARSSGFDLIVVVDVPPELQVERLVRQRGMTAEDATARMAAQATREQRLAIADIVIDNSGPLADLDSRVKEAWTELRARALGRFHGFPGGYVAVIGLPACPPSGPAVTAVRFAAFCPGGFHDPGLFTALFAGNDPRSWQGGQRGGHLITRGRINRTSMT